ncbi:MAG: flavodoxin-dependent (E)-4-hydroxy-3-methylbut-2-enyl-diphosphate synthase [Planctomycetes bacterium]|nr:flavodoxin-dependent (E)-4-hydroxy-3-methylbut-2-enyl-diphosphate synthase [Planctomycetota bacterium]
MGFEVKRRKTRTCTVGDRPLGGDHLVAVQTMTKTKTHDVEGTLAQIRGAQDKGVDIVRVACPDEKSALALPAIIEGSRVPIIADIHFAPGLALKALEAGVHCVRINPGNIKLELVQKIVALAKDKGAAIRIGVNSGSIMPRKGLEVKTDMELVMADHMVETAVQWCEQFDKWGFHNFKVSLKSSDVLTTVYTNREFAKQTDVPLHLGVTEAGMLQASTVKSSIGLGTLLQEGIGDTIRVSITGDPLDEVDVGFEILSALRLRKKNVEIVACPSCGRDEVDGGVETLARQVEERLRDYTGNITVSVLGCIVNGPGEAAEADLGIAGAKDAGYLFKGETILRRVPNEKLVDELMIELYKMEKERAGEQAETANA